MDKWGGLKLLGVVAVLGTLLAVTGSLIVSLAAGGQPAVKALNYDDRVRFVVEGANIEILRAEVFDLAGRRLFDSGPVMGKALDWNMSSESGERAAHGVYLPSAQFFQMLHCKTCPLRSGLSDDETFTFLQKTTRSVPMV